MSFNSHEKIFIARTDLRSATQGDSTIIQLATLDVPGYYLL